MSYTPRRMPKRFLDGAPAGILDIFDNGGETHDRYTVVYNYPDQDGRDIWLPYRGMSEHPSSPQGFGILDIGATSSLYAHDAGGGSDVQNAETLG